MKRRMVAELTRRATAESTAEDPVTALDVVVSWVAGGGYLKHLAEDLTKVIGQPVSVGVLSAWANKTPEGKAALLEARALDAHNLVEESQEILDDLAGTEVTREEVALAKARSDVRQWRASKYNRVQFGADVAQVNVAVSGPALHLEALRVRSVEAKTAPILAPSVEGEDYEIVTGRE
jgi:hypothetical protein